MGRLSHSNALRLHSAQPLINPFINILTGVSLISLCYAAMMGSSFAISLPPGLGSLCSSRARANIARAAGSRLVLIIHTTMPSLLSFLAPCALSVFGLALDTFHIGLLPGWRDKGDEKRGRAYARL